MPIYELGQALTHLSQEILSFWPGDGTLGISGWGMCPGGGLPYETDGDARRLA